MLFNEIVFGPIHSRRLGSSLGINLLPVERKYCNFDCIYCECGWNPTGSNKEAKLILHAFEDIQLALETALSQLQKPIDSITFSGNGEPTIHPEFGRIIDMVIALRNQYVPQTVITVLSNATQLHRNDVFEALQKIENPILKLDAGTAETFRHINGGAANHLSFPTLLEHLNRFKHKAVIQTLLLRGMHNGIAIDNTTEEEFSLWLQHIETIQPHSVMLYAIDRATPEKQLEKLTIEELERFADRVRRKGIATSTFG